MIEPRPERDVNAYLLMITFRVFFAELAVSAVNYFVLMRRVYEPRAGALRAHQIGMATRIARTDPPAVPSVTARVMMICGALGAGSVMPIVK